MPRRNGVASKEMILSNGQTHAVPMVRITPEQRNIDYRTPRWLFDLLNQEFHFTIDGCASPQNALCPRYCTLEQDALRQDWAGERVWWNPPFDDLGAWARKAYNESLLGVTSVGLVPTWKKEYWFRMCVEHAQMRMVQTGPLYFAGDGAQEGRLANWTAPSLFSVPATRAARLVRSLSRPGPRGRRRNFRRCEPIRLLCRSQKAR